MANYTDLTIPVVRHPLFDFLRARGYWPDNTDDGLELSTIFDEALECLEGLEHICDLNDQEKGI